jgi:hypothetical protein
LLSFSWQVAQRCGRTGPMLLSPMAWHELQRTCFLITWTSCPRTCRTLDQVAGT